MLYGETISDGKLRHHLTIHVSEQQGFPFLFALHVRSSHSLFIFALHTRCSHSLFMAELCRMRRPVTGRRPHHLIRSSPPHIRFSMFALHV